MSGHSKWSQIKHKKAIVDAKKGQVFSRFVREIALAARVGGAIVENNSQLRAAIERAHQAGVPKQNIERALARASGSADGVALEDFTYEATGRDGAMMIITGITDNKNRSFAEIKHLVTKHGASIAEPGSALWNFTRIGLIEITRTDNEERAAEEIELAIIDADPSDFHEEGGVWFVETSYERLDPICKSLEKVGLVLRNREHHYQANSTVTLPEGALTQLLTALEEHGDVQEVYTNLNT